MSPNFFALCKTLSPFPPFLFSVSCFLTKKKKKEVNRTYSHGYPAKPRRVANEEAVFALVRPRLVCVVEMAFAVVRQHLAGRRHEDNGVVARGCHCRSRHRRRLRWCIGGGSDFGIADAHMALQAPASPDGPLGRRS